MGASVPIYDAASEQQLMTELWRPEIADDPRNFVRFIYPWGKSGTPLADLSGPRNWQDKLLLEMATYIKDARNHMRNNKVAPEMYRQAIASGRGTGKSALFGWLSHWMVSTRIGASVWVAANSEPQLRTKTFPEIAKWVSMGLNSHWFDVLATGIAPAKWLAELVLRDLKTDPQYWYIRAQLWSEENPDAFAGAHNTYGEMALFDEASGIASSIWTVQQGVFTENIIDRYWLAFSNPRRNSGAFFECFHKDRAAWHRSVQIDARTIEGMPQDTFNNIIATHGADSDEARVEVYGKFPDSANNQFIGSDTVDAAQVRDVIPDPGAPLVFGVDVARSGKAQSVVAIRKGRDARSYPWIFYKGSDTNVFASMIASAAVKMKVDAIFVDGNGVGGGVVDNLKAWRFNVIEVQAGSTADDDHIYKNKRAEIWGRMKEWLMTGAIPTPKMSKLLKPDLTGLEYSYDPVSNKIVLESKDHMAERGLASPDEGDALAMTFARPIARNDLRVSRQNSRRHSVARDVDYPMFG